MTTELKVEAIIPEELKARFLAIANEIWMSGYAQGWHNGILMFDNSTADGFGGTIANVASHVPGTEAPIGESWEKMAQRERESGATSVAAK